jgi:hypothetical protein
MKKSVRLFSFVIVCLILIGLFVIVGVIAEEDSDEGSNFAVDNFPLEVGGEEIISSVGEMNPRTGLPKKFEDLKANSKEFYNREQNQSFLWKEWTKILSDKPVIGPIMFYTNSIFSFFNPVWNYSFGLNFSWSVAFFLSFVIWVMLVILIYYPVSEFSENKVIGVIVSIIVACLAGTGGAIEQTVVFLTPLLTNFISFLIAMVVVYFLMKLYSDFMEARGNESRKKEVERAEDKTIALGDASEKGLEKLGNG